MAVTAAAPPRPSAPAIDSVNAYKYVAFENKFRGSEGDIGARLLQYVDVFDGADGVLDFGCDRGQFLALLRDRGVRAYGLDINHEMVEACRAAGLDAMEGDALAHLESLPDASLGGLIAVQVVEHFQPAYLTRFLDVAYHKMKPGSAIALETLNPSCWFAFFEVYIRDITHAWPLHPDTLKFLVVASGFQRVDVRWLCRTGRREAAARRGAGRRPDGQHDGARPGVQRERRQGQRGHVLVPGLRGGGGTDLGNRRGARGEERPLASRRPPLAF